MGKHLTFKGWEPVLGGAIRVRDPGHKKGRQPRGELIQGFSRNGNEGFVTGDNRTGTYRECRPHEGHLILAHCRGIRRLTPRYV